MPDPKDDAVIDSAKRARGALKRNGPKVPNEREFRMEQLAEAGAEDKPPPPVTSPQPGDHLWHFSPKPVDPNDPNGIAPNRGDVYDQRTQRWRPRDEPVRRYDPTEDKRNEPHHKWRRRPPEVFRDPREKWFDGPKPPVTRI